MMTPRYDEVNVRDRTGERWFCSLCQEEHLGCGFYFCSVCGQMHYPTCHSVEDLEKRIVEDQELLDKIKVHRQ